MTVDWSMSLKHMFIKPLVEGKDRVCMTDYTERKNKSNSEPKQEPIELQVPHNSNVYQDRLVRGKSVAVTVLHIKMQQNRGNIKELQQVLPVLL